MLREGEEVGAASCASVSIKASFLAASFAGGRHHRLRKTRILSLALSPKYSVTLVTSHPRSVPEVVPRVVAASRVVSVAVGPAAQQLLVLHCSPQLGTQG